MQILFLAFFFGSNIQTQTSSSIPDTRNSTVTTASPSTTTTTTTTTATTTTIKTARRTLTESSYAGTGSTFNLLDRRSNELDNSSEEFIVDASRSVTIGCLFVSQQK